MVIYAWLLRDDISSGFAMRPVGNNSFGSGMEMAVIGTVSALAGYVVGLIFKVPIVR